jgi:ectoine hydroxylase-related dioxygenase (phytanoyl-CoA dioxygenase family)
MYVYSEQEAQLAKDGFALVEGIYAPAELAQILQCIAETDMSGSTFRKTDDLFAIRQFFKSIPAVLPLIFNEKLKEVVRQLMGDDYFVVKSIYFDKPPQSNWFVAWHQDLTISVDKRADIAGYGPWTVKQDQFAVQPPLPVLEQNCTIRIHLDAAGKENGALKVIPGSHAKGIYRPETIDWNKEKEVICEVAAGGIMLMKPLLLHASGRTTNNLPRRVLHIEFSNQVLQEPLHWAEKFSLV